MSDFLGLELEYNPPEIPVKLRGVDPDGKPFVRECVLTQLSIHERDQYLAHVDSAMTKENKPDGTVIRRIDDRTAFTKAELYILERTLYCVDPETKARKLMDPAEIAHLADESRRAMLEWVKDHSNLISERKAKEMQEEGEAKRKAEADAVNPSGATS